MHTTDVNEEWIVHWPTFGQLTDDKVGTRGMKKGSNAIGCFAHGLVLRPMN